MSARKEAFGKTPEGRDASLFTLENDAGLCAQITDFGGIIVSLLVPDKRGRQADVVLGYDNIEDYLSNPPYFGAIIGRCANRIANARLRLSDMEYILSANFGAHHLHGGIKGFNKALWDTQTYSGNGIDTLVLSYRSANMEEGYPGNLDVSVTYSLNAENELCIDYEAVSDQDTVVNLTNHSYFSIAGSAGPAVPEIFDCKLQITADRFVVIGNDQLPTGEIRCVDGTPMDFRIPTEIRLSLENGYEQIAYGNGLDHCWVLESEPGRPKLAARLFEPSSGRSLSVLTTMPGIQVFTPDFSSMPVAGKHNAKYNGRNAICLETQYYPNAIWHPHFPSPVLSAGRQYSHRTVFRFSTDDI